MSADFRAKLRLDMGAMQVARARALGEISQDLLSRSRRNAPLRTGALIASGRAEVDGGRAIVRYTAPYAYPVHEHHPNGRAGYLLRALEDPATLEFAAEAYARALRGMRG